jgi:ribonuclease HII
VSKYIIGSDEVGLGAWAGPLVVCAVAVKKDWLGILGLNDSKALSRRRREQVYKELVGVKGLRLSLMKSESTDIDRNGIHYCLKRAHTEAIEYLLADYPDAEIVVDGDLKLKRLPQAKSIPKADSLFPSVMAASIIAKVNRDWTMIALAKQYPEYGFESHVGYGTKKHQEALKKYGPCPIHRRSYRPIREILQLPLFAATLK